MSDPSRALVFERYEGGEQTLREHMGRPAHKALMDKMQSGRMTRRKRWIAMGYEVDGFSWRFSQEAESRIKGDGIVLAVIALSSSHTMALVDSCREHADACFSNDLGTERPQLTAFPPRPAAFNASPRGAKANARCPATPARAAPTPESEAWGPAHRRRAHRPPAA